MHAYSDLSPAKYILLGREDISATVICMAEAQESQLEGLDPMPLGGEVSGLTAMESPVSAFHTPHLHPLSPSRSTIASGRSSGHSRGAVHRGSRPYMPVWHSSPGGTPVHPVVGKALREQWASRCVDRSRCMHCLSALACVTRTDGMQVCVGASQCSEARASRV